MAKQKGIFKVKGTIDDVTFYKSKDGFLVRQKGGVSKERIATDPAFERTRENQNEFARAGKAGKVLRTSIRSMLLSASDGRMISRLLKEMMKVVKADATSERGQRNVLDGELELLEGFEFNEGGKLSQTLFAPFTASIDRATGVLSVSIDDFVPINTIAAPAEATYFEIVTAGGAIDFALGTHGITSNSSGVLPLNAVAAAAISNTYNAGANSTQPLFLFIGISFFQEVNGKNYSLKNGAFNALSIVKVSGV